MTSPPPPAPVANPADPSAGDWPSTLDRLASGLLGHFADLHAHPVAVKEVESGVYCHVNAAMAELFGRPASEVVGSTDAQLLSAHRASALRAADQTALAHHPQASRAEHRFEWQGKRRHFGALRMVMADPRHPDRLLVASIWTDQGESDRLAELLASQRQQIEQDQRLLERLQGESLSRSPFGSRVAGAFAADLRREFDLSSRERREFVLMLVELDDPPFGEPERPEAEAEALRAALDRLILANTRAMDSVCGLSPTRTAVLWSGVGVTTAYARAEVLRQQCEHYEVAFEGAMRPMSVSIGLAAYPHTTEDREALSGAAEQALARARSRGAGQVALAAVPFPRAQARAMGQRGVGTPLSEERAGKVSVATHGPHS